MIDLDHLRQWIGREEVVHDLVPPSLADRFRATFDLAGAPAAMGDAAPEMIHLCLALPAAPTAGLGPDGHPARGGFLPPVPLPRRMWAGGALRFHAPIRLGATVTRRSVIRDVTLKEGRTGALCFVTVDHRMDCDGALAVEERHDIVYRDAGGAAPAKAPQPAAAGAHQETRSPTAPLLFRYSALTFNGHRIHYDQPYTTTEEGYPGLVVHGPLQVKMLVQLATRLRGRAPNEFDFRALSPLFDTTDFTLNADEDGDGLRLWTAAVGGPMAMEARARW